MKDALLPLLLGFIFGLSLQGLSELQRNPFEDPQSKYIARQFVQGYWTGYGRGHWDAGDSLRKDFETDMLLYLEEQHKSWQDVNICEVTFADVFFQLQHGVSEGDYVLDYSPSNQ
jgi:hypothetical protein